MKAQFVIILLMMTAHLLGQSGITSTDHQDYDEMITGYLQHLDAGEHSAELYQNLGFAYYQLGDLAHAMLYYERANKLSQHDDIVLKSIDHIRAELPVQISDIPDFILLRIYRSTSKAASASTWAFLQVAFALIMLGLCYLFFIKKQELSNYIRLSILAGVTFLSLICGLLSYHSHSVEKGGDQAISMQKQEVYKAADERSQSVVSIDQGNKVFLLDSIGDWYKVQLRDKNTGWVKKDKVTLI